MKTKAPKQTMRDFFARADVKQLQEIQKRNHPDNAEHKQATEAIARLAKEIGAERFFN